MRKTPVEKAPAPPATDTPAAEKENHFIDLSERLKKKAAPAPETETKTETTSATVEEQAPEQKENKDTQQEPTATEPTNGSATFDEGSDFDKFAKGVNEKFTEADAVEIAEMIVSFGNIGRIIFLPGIYEGLMYPGQERNDIRDVMRRSVDNEKANKEPTEGFNNYDKRLFEKWPLLRKATENVSFTEPEIKTFAKYLARQIGEMSVSVWMQKYMWLVYWLYLEAKHSSPIIQGKTADFMTKKFGLK